MLMEEDRFWGIIDASRRRAQGLPRQPSQDFVDLHERTLAEALRGLPPPEVVAFRERFNYFHGVAYRWDLWAAAYWLHGGCGDDGFIDFRSNLIGLGKARFFQVLNDPDALADLVDLPDVPYLQAEGIQYVPSRVYKELTGEQMPAGDSYGPVEPVGHQIDHDDAEVMRRLFPKLVAKFPDMGD